MFKHTLRLLLATFLLAMVPWTGQAQEGTPPPAPTAAPETPPTTEGPAIEVDQTQADLEREQAEMEQAEQPSQTDTVVESNAEKEEKNRTEEAQKASRGHGGQFGIRAGFGLPVVMLGFRYGENGIPCDGKAKVNNTCSSGKRMGLGDFELSYGLTDGFELTGGVRIGFAKHDVSGTDPFAIALGIRSYLSAKSIFKFFIGVKAIIDITPSDRPDWKGTDFGARGEFGIQLDFLRYLGAYVQVAETVTVLRYLSFVTDVTGGLQVRFP